jgi:hypothetical protein
MSTSSRHRPILGALRPFSLSHPTVESGSVPSPRPDASAPPTAIPRHFLFRSTISACCFCWYVNVQPLFLIQKAHLISILLYADMYFFIVMHISNYNTCQHTGQCTSTCIQNFIMHVNKKYVSTYRRMQIEHACQRKIACQHTASFPFR